MHRKHHAFTDRDGDPHSPWLRGSPKSRAEAPGDVEADSERGDRRTPAAGSRWGDRAHLQAHTGEIIGYVPQATAALLRWLTGAWVIVLIPVFAFFILKDAEGLTVSRIAMGPRSNGQKLLAGTSAKA